MATSILVIIFLNFVKSPYLFIHLSLMHTFMHMFYGNCQYNYQQFQNRSNHSVYSNGKEHQRPTFGNGIDFQSALKGAANSLSSLSNGRFRCFERGDKSEARWTDKNFKGG